MIVVIGRGSVIVVNDRVSVVGEYASVEGIGEHCVVGVIGEYGGVEGI